MCILRLWSGGVAGPAVAAGVSPAEAYDGLRGRRPLRRLRAQPALERIPPMAWHRLPGGMCLTSPSPHACGVGGREQGGGPPVVGTSSLLPPANGGRGGGCQLHTPGGAITGSKLPVAPRHRRGYRCRRPGQRWAWPLGRGRFRFAVHWSSGLAQRCRTLRVRAVSFTRSSIRWPITQMGPS